MMSMDQVPIELQGGL
jgi:hypothetical protein